MLDINDYLLQYERKIPNILLLWTIIGAFIIIFGLIISNTVKINDYYQINGIVKDQYLSVLVSIDELKTVTENDNLYIDDIKYNYTIERIGEEIIQDSNVFYKELFLDVDLKNKNFVDNNVIKIKFIAKEKTIFKYIFDLIKGEY